MPGFFGFLSRSQDKPAEDLASKMQECLEHGEDWFEGKYFHYQSGFYGVVDFKARLENNNASSNEKDIIIYGDLYSSGGLRIPSESKAQTVLSLYDKGGLDFIKHLN